MKEIKYRWHILGFIAETNEYYFITSFKMKWQARWYVFRSRDLHKGNIHDKGVK